MANTLKVTFTLDSGTVERLDVAADRLGMPKSQIVRDAVAEFYERLGRLSDRERMALLRTFDDVVPRIATRKAEDVDAELAELRQARQSGGRRTAVETE